MKRCKEHYPVTRLTGSISNGPIALDYFGPWFCHSSNMACEADETRSKSGRWILGVGMEFFKPEDFVGFIMADANIAALTGNEKLANETKVIYKLPGHNDQWSETKPYICVVKAYLVCEKFIECEHEVVEVVLSGKWTGHISGITNSWKEGELIKPTTLLSPVCKHCGKKLKPTAWSVDD